MFHDFCVKVSSFTTSLVVSVTYRLAPEHRLPAAYDDGMDALLWIRSSYGKSILHDHEWLAKYGDFSNCFLMGSSAGGTLAYKVGLRASMIVDDINPLIIKGLILHYPSFGGLKRTRSELEHVNDPYVPQSVGDLFSELCLPIGASRDHDHVNLRAGLELGILDRLKELGWTVLVTGGSSDPCMDRQLELVKLLKEKGVVVKEHFTLHDSHAVEIFNLIKCHLFLVVAKDFIYSSMSSVKATHQKLLGLKANL